MENGPKRREKGRLVFGRWNGQDKAAGGVALNDARRDCRRRYGVWSDAVHDRAILHHHWSGLTPYLSEKTQESKKFEGTFVLQGKMYTASIFSSSIYSSFLWI